MDKNSSPVIYSEDRTPSRSANKQNQPLLEGNKLDEAKDKQPLSGVWLVLSRREQRDEKRPVSGKESRYCCFWWPL